MGLQSVLNQIPLSSAPTILLDESLLGLDVFLKDFGWNVIKVKPRISDDEVLRIAEEAGYVLVTEDGVLAKRCRLKRVKVVELGVEEQASLIDQILRRDFKT